MPGTSRYKNYKAVVVDGPGGTRRIRLFPPPSPRLLASVERAARLPRGDARNRKLRRAVLAAYKGGHTVADMSRTAPVSRQTIYGILHAADVLP